ncbi:M23 family metallopeptidase [Limosilactobacillus oris]|uniref:M23 family metallopeptidase n=1 Tax=Limosilactobacillus oris TaxID=1632 RepID=UPI00242BCC59|nr:M23 family metallopeptidase [Limosilactobacillus oris]
MEESTIFNLKNFKSKILPTITVCGSALFLMHGKVSADQIDNTNQKQASVQTLDQNNTNTNGTSGTDNNNNSEAATAQVSSQAADNGQNVNNQPNANTENTADQAGANEQATTDNGQETVTYDTKDNGNYAAVDNASLNTNGQLNINGWHATNDAKGKDYHYVIVLDQDNKEIARQNVTDDAVARPDVQRVHNVYGAGQSGFNVQFNLSKSVLANTSSIRIISRYSSDPYGNQNNIDYWFAPITVDRKNYGYLDIVSVSNGQLNVAGWNTTNQAADKPYHIIMVVDQTTGQTVAQQLVTGDNQRDDIARIYTQIDGAGQSGFNVHFSLNQLNLNHKLQVVSRYSTSKDGMGSNVDYYFTPITTGNYTNQGNLDSFNVSNGQTLTITGWHADDISKLENNHFLILFDNTANKQVASVNAATVARPDVARAFPSVATAGQSGYKVSFDLAGINLVPGHSYSVVSRYSTSAEDNGGGGQYTDYWFAPVNYSQQASAIDSIKTTKDGVQVAGWMASDYAAGHDNAYILIMNDGKEVARQKVELFARPDVAKAFPGLYNSANSGFNTLVKLDPTRLTGNLQVLLRFSGSADGNVDCVDQWSKNYSTSAGGFDEINVLDSSIYVSGWHASEQTADKPYQFLIFIDQNTGKEIYRQQVLDTNNSRPDLAKAYPQILDSDKAGFKLGFTIPSSLDHHTVRIIHRFTNDVYGNGNSVDMWSDPISIHNNRWAWPFPSTGQGSFMGAQLFGVNPGGEFRQNGFHDGLDFGAYDHPGSQVHAIHSGTIVGVGYTAGLDWYVLEDTGEYLIVYQEAFSNRGNINVVPGQKIEVGDVIGNRDTSHVHIGITREHNFNRALAKSFTNDGTWLNPLEIIRNGLNG